MHALIDALDQRELPCAALHLPGAQRDKAQKQGDAHHCEHRLAKPPGLGDRGCGVGRHQGVEWPGASCVAGVGVGCSGIMFAFMWNMTHSVPAMAMATNTTVKMVDSMVQPPSTLPFMCRK